MSAIKRSLIDLRDLMLKLYNVDGGFLYKINASVDPSSTSPQCIKLDFLLLWVTLTILDTFCVEHVNKNATGIWSRELATLCCIGLMFGQFCRVNFRLFLGRLWS